MRGLDEVVETSSAPTYVVVSAALFALAIVLLASALRVRARARRRQELEAREELSAERRARLEQF